MDHRRASDAPRPMPKETLHKRSAAAIHRGAMSASVNILLLEDVVLTAEVVKGYLAAVSPKAQVKWVQTLAAALKELDAGSFDLVLSDLNLPDSTGMDTLDRVLAGTDGLVVVLTSEDESASHNAALDRGAYDFLHKSRLSKATLGQLIRLATIQAETFRILRQNIAELELRQRQLDNLSLYDSLTGAPNRSLLLERADRVIGETRQAGTKVPLLLADIDRFRAVNESLGRGAGDELLRQVATRLSQAIGRNEIGRTGADQFAVVLPVVRGRSEAARRARALLDECFGEAFSLGDHEVRVSARAGIALAPSDGTDAETALKHAEAALRSAKSGGESTVFYTPSLTTWTTERLALENKLRIALENEEFLLHYQPKIGVESGAIVGVEALIRWNSPELGLVPPMRFVPLLEETGLIAAVGAWVLRQALATQCRWAEMGLAAPRVAVNVSQIQLRNPDFVATIEDALRGRAWPTGFSPSLEVEVTEGLFMRDIESNIRKLGEIRNLGVGVAIDDFGTGYSSLAYLARAPIQSLKVDRAFVAGMLSDTPTMTLVQTIISLARALNLRVVAEGVDSEEQAKMLRLLRCDEMQGNFLGRPVPAAEIDGLLGRAR